MSNFATPARWLADWLSERFGSTNGKVSATERSICGIPAVLYATEKYRSLFGQLPFYPMERVSFDFSEHEGAKRAKDHQFYRVCKTRPTPGMSAAVFRETLITHAIHWGNGRAAIAGTPASPELLLLQPDRSDTVMIEGEKYHVSMPDVDDRVMQQINTAETDREAQEILRHEMIANVDKVIVLHDSEVLHLPGFGWDGIKGKSIVSVCREVFESQLHTIRHLKKNWEKGFLGSMMIKAPRDSGLFRDEAQAKKWLEAFKQNMSGSDGEKIGLLTHGLEAQVLSMSGRDAQWVEQMRSQRQDVALMFMLESIMGDDRSISYNSEEMKSIAFLVGGLNRWLVKLEQEADEKLLTRKQKKEDTHFFKHNVGALLKTDQQTQATIISQYITARVMSPNEARIILDLLPYDGGDDYGNPAIDVMPGDEPEEPPRIEGPPDNGQARAIVSYRVEQMQALERKKLFTSAAIHKNNYIEWLGEFYAKFEKTLGRELKELDSVELGLYCKSSRDRIIDAMAKSGKAASLQTIVQAETETWGDRAEKLVDLILGVTADV